MVTKILVAVLVLYAAYLIKLCADLYADSKYATEPLRKFWLCHIVLYLGVRRMDLLAVYQGK